MKPPPDPDGSCRGLPPRVFTHTAKLSGFQLFCNLCRMNLERFIATRVAFSEHKSFSRLIIRIAVIAVALSLAVMIIAMASIAGFKHQIGEKIFGFWGHIHITSTQINRTTGESLPISIHQPFNPSLAAQGPITYSEPWRIAGLELPLATNPAHARRHPPHAGLRAQTRHHQDPRPNRRHRPQRYRARFRLVVFRKIPARRPPPPTRRLSALAGHRPVDDRPPTASDLDLGDKFIFHFVKDGEVFRRPFVVEGIFKTGLEEYDRKFALVDIRRTQEMLGWREDQIGGFEVFVEDLRDLNVFTDYIYFEVLPGDLYCESIREKFPAIFEWLALQDINEVVIIVLMLIVGIINMITALMILILERTNMIGILKALGHTNWGIRKIFLYYAGYILLFGLLWGNAIGVGFCLLQQRFGFIRLDEANYYLSVAPIELNFLPILLLNVGVLAVTLVFLLLPSWLVTRVSPVKAIRFK
ncbi:MAG: permease [Saprospiraceae bacterium]|nr:MAG: permease [Saprospiraceae bacterium]